MDYKDFYYKKDRLNQLRGFCLTVQNNSIMKAASIMHVEPATISKQIQSLERDLNISLFDRSYRKQRLTITEKGKEFYKVAVKAMQTVECAFNYFKNEGKEGEKREINFAVHHTATNYLIPKYIKKFQEKEENKNINFNIHIIKPNEIFDKLKNEEIDFALHIVEDIPPEFDTKGIFELEPTILMHKDNVLANKEDNKITFEDLSKQNMICIDKNTIIKYFVDTCKEYKLNGNINFVEGGDWEVVRNFIKLDLGIHMYSTTYDKFEEFKDKDLISKKVKNLFPNMYFKLIVKKGRILNKFALEFLDILINDLNGNFVLQ